MIPIGAGPTPEGSTAYRRFRRIAEGIDELDDRGAVSFVWRTDEQLVMSIDPEAQGSHEMFELLGLDPTIGNYVVRLGIDEPAGDEVVIKTRPMIGALFYLSQSI